MKFIPRYIFLTLIFFVVAVSASTAATFTGYRLIKISASDQRAVIKRPDGSLRVVAPGDVVDGAHVYEMAEGRMVLKGKAGETIIVRLEQGRQRIESYLRAGEQVPPLTAPAGEDKEVASQPNGAGKN